MSIQTQNWKRRWFRLVVALYRNHSGGPVFLEYFDKPKSVEPLVRYLICAAWRVCVRVCKEDVILFSGGERGEREIH